MKKLILVVVSLVALVSVTSAEAGGHRGGYHSTSHVNGYYRSNGSYVSPHYRSGRDGYHNNNWSVQGNVNPYTGNRARSYMTVIDLLHNLTYIKNYKNSVI